MEVSDQLHAPATLPLDENPWYPSDRKLDGPQRRSGRGDEEKIPGHCKTVYNLLRMDTRQSHSLYGSVELILINFFLLSIFIPFLVASLYFKV
jgi:hypothetical protein